MLPTTIVNVCISVPTMIIPACDFGTCTHNNRFHFIKGSLFQKTWVKEYTCDVIHSSTYKFYCPFDRDRTLRHFTITVAHTHM